MKATEYGTAEKTMEPFDSAVPEGEGALEAMASEKGEKGRELRARMQAAIEKSKVICERLQARTVAAAKATDTALRQHPYPAIGLAFGVGLLIGVLAMRNRRN